MEEVAVVTGASAGIGEAIALRLLDSGHTVIALQRKAPRIAHAKLIYVGADLSDTQQTTEAAAEIATQYGVRYLVKMVTSPGRPFCLRWNQHQRDRRAVGFSSRKKRRELRGVFLEENALVAIAFGKHFFALLPELRQYDH